MSPLENIFKKGWEWLEEMQGTWESLPGHGRQPKSGKGGAGKTLRQHWFKEKGQRSGEQ